MSRRGTGSGLQERGGPPVLLRRTGGRGASWRATRGGTLLAEAGLTSVARTVAGAAPGAEVVLLAPSPDLRLAAVRLAGVAARQRPMAAAYALEDGLADEVEQLEIRVSSRPSADEYSVAILDRHRLAGWLAACRAGGLRPRRVLPVLLCLPWQPGCLCVAREAELVYLRWGTWQAQCVPATLLPALLAGLAAAQLQPERVTVLGEISAWPAQSTAAHWPDVPVVAAGTSLDDALASGLAGVDSGLDLARRDDAGAAAWRQLLRPWRLPAALAAVLMLALTGLTLHDMAGLRAEREQWDARTRALYQAAFPDARRVSDVERLMRQRLARAGSSAGQPSALVLLAGAARATAAVPAVELRRIGYRGGGLELELAAADLTPFETWRARLGELAPALRGETVSAVATPDGATARMQVRPR